jgi:hypothetical protein
MSTPTLEQRIAAALSASDIKSAKLDALVQETEVAIIAADATAEAERAKALDPIASPDAAMARQAMEAAAFARDRLKTVLPRLRERRNEVEHQEKLAAWTADFEQVQTKRDVLAKELRERYPVLAAELVNLMVRIKEVDAEVRRVALSAPLGAKGRLHEVELTARGIDRLSPPDVEIARELRLPNFSRADNEPVLAWPPREPTLAEQYLATMPPPQYDARYSADWHTTLAERDEKLKAEADYVAAHYQRQAEERRKREAAELAKARAEDAAAWSRQREWPA